MAFRLRARSCDYMHPEGPAELNSCGANPTAAAVDQHRGRSAAAQRFAKHILLLVACTKCTLFNAHALATVAAMPLPILGPLPPPGACQWLRLACPLISPLFWTAPPP